MGSQKAVDILYSQYLMLPSADQNELATLINFHRSLRAVEQAAASAEEVPGSSTAECQSKEGNVTTNDAQAQPKGQSKAAQPGDSDSSAACHKRYYAVTLAPPTAPDLLGIHHFHWSQFQRHLPNGHVHRWGGHVQGLNTLTAAVAFWKDFQSTDPKMHHAY